MSRTEPKPSNGELRLQELHVSYGRHEVLHGITGHVSPGEIVAVLGPNGAGKSTLLQCCLQLVVPSAGRVLLGDADVASLSAESRARRMAFLPQTCDWAFPFRAGEVVLMGRRPYQRGFGFESTTDLEHARDALHRTSTWELRDRFLHTLSGGERQRVMLAAALVQEPEYLFLDEPTASLDLLHQAEFLALLREHARPSNTGVLMASHDLSLAASVADRLWLLHEGRIAFEGPPQDVLAPDNLAKVYGIACDVQPGPGSTRVLPRWDRIAGGGS